MMATRVGGLKVARGANTRTKAATTARQARVAPAKYRTKRDYAVAWIRQAILTGYLEPGSRLRQDELVRELRVSPTPIREAIRMLEAEGVLRTRPHRGVIVASLSPEELLQVYWVRVGLESIAARLAVGAERQEGSDRLADRLARLQAAMQDRFRAGQAHRVPELNMRFHFALIEASGSPLLVKMCHQLWVNLPHHFFWQRRARAQRVLEQHDAIVRAVRAGDPDAAEAAMHAHVQWAAETLDIIREAQELAAPLHWTSAARPKLGRVTPLASA